MWCLGWGGGAAFYLQDTNVELLGFAVLSHLLVEAGNIVRCTHAVSVVYNKREYDDIIIMRERSVRTNVRRFHCSKSVCDFFKSLKNIYIYIYMCVYIDVVHGELVFLLRSTLQRLVEMLECYKERR